MKTIGLSTVRILFGDKFGGSTVEKYNISLDSSTNSTKINLELTKLKLKNFKIRFKS